MNFALKVYWLFLVLVVVGVWSLPIRFRKAWLLAASIVFYATWSIPYLGLLMGAAALNHFGAKWIVAGDRSRRGKVVIASNLLLLGVFKYLAWVLGMFSSAAAWVGLNLALPIPKWAMPMGISFYLFESISYIVDVMRKREKVHSFWDFQLFIAFFPKLISGPILRAKEFLPQVERPLQLRPSDVRFAVREIIVGLFMKLVLADSIGRRVDLLFSRPANTMTSLDVWIMGIAFGVQLYLDFSAYTRMAIGCSKLCGIDLVQNFNHPFIATSPPDYWNRWHMSLSRWVRDYLFYPMAQASSDPTKGPFVRRLKLMWAAFITMVVFGLWHGGSYPYLAYGIYHGAILAGYHLLKFRGNAREQSKVAAAAADSPVRALLFPFASWALTFALFTIGFIIFRSATLTDAFVLIGRAVRPLTYPGRTVKDYIAFRAIGMLLIILSVGYLTARKSQVRRAPGPRVNVADPSYALAAAEGLGLGVLAVVTLIEMNGRDATFVYFQF